MCKIKAEGGPCAAHSRQRLVKAVASGDNKRIATARLEFELTSGGIKELRAKGEDFLADLRQAERNEIRAEAIREQTTDRVELIAERVAIATSGPWDYGDHPSKDGDWLYRKDDKYNPIADFEFTDVGDADFIAHAREDIPWLLDALAKAERDLDSALYERDMSRRGKTDAYAQLYAAEQKLAATQKDEQPKVAWYIGEDGGYVVGGEGLGLPEVAAIGKYSEPPVGSWVRDKYGATSYRQKDGWGQPGMMPYGKWEAMWDARGPYEICKPWGRE